MRLEQMYHGRSHDILGYTTDRGDQLVRDYILGLGEARLTKAIALLKTVGDFGPPLHNPEKCKKVADTDFYELKPSQTDRIFWFPDEASSNLIVFHAFEKTSGEIPQSDLKVGRARLREIKSFLRGSH